MKGEHLKKQLQQFSLGGREISLKDLTKSPPTADRSNRSYGHNFVPVRYKFGWAAENIP